MSRWEDCLQLFGGPNVITKVLIRRRWSVSQGKAKVNIRVSQGMPADTRCRKRQGNRIPLGEKSPGGTGPANTRFYPCKTHWTSDLWDYKRINLSH